MDVGLLQRDSVTVEYEETVANLSKFFSQESLERKTNSIVDALMSPFKSNSQELWGRDEEISHDSSQLTSDMTVSSVRNSGGEEEREIDERSNSITWIPDIIVTDISILAIYVRDEVMRRTREVIDYVEDAGEKRNISVVMITNFTWTCIYSPLVAIDNRFQPYIDVHRRAYAGVDSLLVLPFYLPAVSDCGVPKDRIRTIGGISRIATVPSDTVKSWLRKRERDMSPQTAHESASDVNVKYLLYSFGGFKAPIEECMQLWKPPPPDWRLVWVDRSPSPARREASCNEQLSTDTKKDSMSMPDSVLTTESIGEAGTHAVMRPLIDRVMVIGEWELEEAGVNYVDLLAAMDVALIKTGFGIVSECIRYRTSVLYVDRPGFEEHKALASALALQISSKEVDLERAKRADVFDLIPAVWPNTLEPQFEFTGVEEAVSYITGQADLTPSTTATSLSLSMETGKVAH